MMSGSFESGSAKDDALGTGAAGQGELGMAEKPFELTSRGESLAELTSDTMSVPIAGSDCHRRSQFSIS